MTARLSYRTLRQVPQSSRPRIDASEVGVGIVHLGLGAFHRAHQAPYTEDALVESPGDWGISGVTQTSRTVMEQLRPQDGLYSVSERSATDTSVRVIGVVREVLSALDEPSAVAARIAAPETRILSLTVTEKGYRCDLSSGRLNTADPGIATDAEGGSPRTAVGQVVRGLQERMRHQAGPLTVLCCDNLAGSGETVRRVVEQFCSLLAPDEGDELQAWVQANVTFPRTMVDRIVPATTAQDLVAARTILRVEDAGAVVAEPYRQWVVEDRFAAGRPAWERVGVTFTDEVGLYERAKVRLLNGSHSMLAYLGGLSGFDSIAEAVAHEELAQAVGRLMDEDVSPTLQLPQGFDLAAYQRSVLERFANPAMRHTTSQVAMDGSQKLPSRLLHTISDRRAEGAQARWACLAVAAWMRYVSSGIDDAGATLALDDPLEARIRALVAPTSSAMAVVSRLLRMTDVFNPELASDEGFRGIVTEDLEQLQKRGALATVREALKSGDL